jgi:hypothetical protein
MKAEVRIAEKIKEHSAVWDVIRMSSSPWPVGVRTPDYNADSAALPGAGVPGEAR